MTTKPPGLPLHIDVRAAGEPPGAAVLLLAGALTGSTATDVRVTVRQLRQTGRTHLVVDLSAIELVDSAGLAALLGVTRRRGSSLRLVAPSPPVDALLHSTGLHRALRCFPTADTALDDLSTRSRWP